MTSSRRALMIGALAASLTPVAVPARRRAANTRPAQAADISALIPLLLRAAERRAHSNPALWALPPDAPARIQAALKSELGPPRGPVRHQWTVIERAGQILGVVHGAVMPAPPLYDPPGGVAGVLLDDSLLPDDAAAARDLFIAAEANLYAAGAQVTVAACPADWPDLQSLYAAAGYRPTTLYMAKSGLASVPASTRVRHATEVDVPAIVALGRKDRAQLAIAQRHFWKPHPEADARFAAWMHTSLHLADREMFVSVDPAVDGYLVAQPASPSQLLPPFDPRRIGLIDDFHTREFATLDGKPGPAPSAAALLDAAEASFRARGLDVALAICPARWHSKAAILERHGYRTANLWMVKG